jgi:hypothetical protein
MAMSARVVRLQNEGMTDSMAQDWARAVLDLAVAGHGLAVGPRLNPY